jgi:hypothetical protein
MSGTNRALEFFMRLLWLSMLLRIIDGHERMSRSFTRKGFIMVIAWTARMLPVAMEGTEFEEEWLYAEKEVMFLSTSSFFGLAFVSPCHERFPVL